MRTLVGLLLLVSGLWAAPAPQAIRPRMTASKPIRANSARSTGIHSKPIASTRVAPGRVASPRVYRGSAATRAHTIQSKPIRARVVNR